MTFKKVIGQIHLWLGLLSGLVVFVLGVTGCIWAFEEEISDWVYRGYYFNEQNDNKGPMLLSETFELVKDSIGSEKDVTFIKVPNDTSRSYIFLAFKKNKDQSSIFSARHEYHVNAYADPYSAIVKVQDKKREFFRVVLNLHMFLGIRKDIGEKIIGWSTITFITMLITGLVLWWPKNQAARKQRVWFRWKPTTKWKRKNYDLHNIIGFYSMFLVIFIALTGLMWSFDWYNNSIRWIANGGRVIEKDKVEVISSLPTKDLGINPLDKAFHNIKRAHPYAKIFDIWLPKDSASTILTRVKYRDPSKNVDVQFDQYTGEQLAANGWKDKSNGDKLYAYNYDIHTGAIGGIVGKTIAFFLGLFAASLPITGFVIWYGRRKKKKTKRSTGTSNHVVTNKAAQAKPMRVHPKIKIPSSID